MARKSEVRQQFLVQLLLGGEEGIRS
jgi:hypothetical protein